MTAFAGFTLLKMVFNTASFRLFDKTAAFRSFPLPFSSLLRRGLPLPAKATLRAVMRRLLTLSR
jgi:hypothetical protein